MRQYTSQFGRFLKIILYIFDMPPFALCDNMLIARCSQLGSIGQIILTLLRNALNASQGIYYRIR
jgi:hypothetical protein